MRMRAMAYWPRQGARENGKLAREGLVVVRGIFAGIILSLGVALAGCASSLDAIPPISDTASFADTGQQLLKAGDSVRIVVFGRDALSGTYALDEQGRLKLASLGSIEARGLTPAELEQKIAALLSDKGVDNAQVSVMIN